MFVSALAHAEDGNDRRHFKAMLKGFNETPSISSPGSGSVQLTINHDDTAIDFVLHYEGMTSEPVQAHIHLGQRHTAGGVVIFFCGPNTPPGPQALPAAAGDDHRYARRRRRHRSGLAGHQPRRVRRAHPRHPRARHLRQRAHHELSGG